MDHSTHMHHMSVMDHGDGGMAHSVAPRCSLNMLWNTQIINTCIVFREWHVGSHVVFWLSCLVIVGLGVGYEWLRVVQRRVDINIARSLRVGLNGGGATRKTVPVPLAARAYRASLYGVTVFLSFFLMLVFMTYNAYLILAVVIGAALGHYIFAGEMDPEAILAGVGEGKGMSCH